MSQQHFRPMPFSPPFQEGCLPLNSFYLVSYPRSGSNWFLAAMTYVAGGVKAEAYLSHELYPHRLGALAEEKGFWVRTATPWLGPPCPLIIKTHAGVDEMTTGFPKGRVVFLMRDPRDALLSYYFFTQAFVGAKTSVEKTVFAVGPNGRDHGAESRREVKFDPGEYAMFLAGNVQDWLAHTRSWLATPGVFLVRYESLKIEFERELQRWLWAFGLPAAQSMAETRRAYVDDFVELLNGNPRAFHRKGIIGDWRTHAADSRVRDAIETHLNQGVLEEFGYRSGNPIV